MLARDKGQTHIATYASHEIAMSSFKSQCIVCPCSESFVVFLCAGEAPASLTVAAAKPEFEEKGMEDEHPAGASDPGPSAFGSATSALVNLRLGSSFHQPPFPAGASPGMPNGNGSPQVSLGGPLR